MVSNKSSFNAVGGKTARPCDGCVKKRARWYCAADDAFLCQACDSSVHSANPLASRHERVRLKTASNKVLGAIKVPSWHQGFTKKPRTPRQVKHVSHQKNNCESETGQNSFPLVPEIGFDEYSSCEIEEQHVYHQVPIYDENDTKPMITGFCDGDDNLHGFLSNDMDLVDFAANVESLLGTGLENECFGLDELIDYKQNNSNDCSLDSGLRVKHEDEKATLTSSFDIHIDSIREPFELDFDYDSLARGEEEDAKVEVDLAIAGRSGGECEEEGENKRWKKNKLLKLDYDSVITVWSECQRCPWTSGTKPELDESWPYFMRNDVRYAYGETSGAGGNKAMGDEDREARVTRYREKRRTRLFSKKIRYEVRKLNAEKRPRMKGRFVKRVSCGVPNFPLLAK